MVTGCKMSRHDDLVFVQSPLPFSVPLACVVFVAHWVNKDHLSHEEGNGCINDGSEAVTVNLHAQHQNSFAEMWRHSCFLYCRLAAELKTHMGKIWPGGWIEMVRRPVPDILKGKLNDAQKSMQAAAWCACGAAALSKFIMAFLSLSWMYAGANILDWLSSCCRFWLEESSISQWTTVQWVTAAQLISQPIAASYGCWYHCMFWFVRFALNRMATFLFAVENKRLGSWLSCVRNLLHTLSYSVCGPVSHIETSISVLL